MAEAAGLVLGAVTLSSLFEHMLMRVEPRYQEQEAYVLWLLYKHHTIPSPGPLPTVGLAAIDRLIAAGADVDMDIDVSVQKRTKCVVMEGRLRSRCCGLLEVVERRADHDMCFCDIELDTETGVQLHDTVVDSSVSFIHRSVFEFLQQPDVRNLGCLKYKKSTHPEPIVLLLHMSVQLLRMIIKGSPNTTLNLYFQTIRSYLDFATTPENFALVKQIEDMVEKLLEKAGGHGIDEVQQDTDTFQPNTHNPANPAIVVQMVD